MNAPKKSMNTKQLIVLAMLTALAYVVVVVTRIPITSVPFLKYEPKDIVIVIGGFLYGPFSAFLVSLAVSLLEMVTISDTGIIGCVMNILSTCAFACTAAYIYKKKRTMPAAVSGLTLGVFLMVAVMIAWNYLLTPLYMDTPRSVVATMLLPVFLPFNLIKGALNMSITLLIYRPLVLGLRRAGLYPQSIQANRPTRSSQILLWAFALLILTASILWIVLK